MAMRDEHLVELMKGENPHSRGTMQAIQNILSKVQDGVKFVYEMRKKILDKAVHPEKGQEQEVYLRPYHHQNRKLIPI
jgi:hypothetical protein